ncbi:MAG: hypothetical protein WD426_01145 [Anditalea sp.]
MKHAILITLICIAAINLTKAQDDRTDRAGVGIGPAMMYGDNTGINRELKFKVLPALTVDYNKKLHTFFDVRGSLGWQMVNSGHFYNLKIIRKIAERNLPHAFKGNAFYADIMPIYHINPNQSGYLPAEYKIYGGVGLGVAHVRRTDQTMVFTEQTSTIRSTKGTNTSVYVPLRLGVTKDFKDDWEIGLEPTLMISFFGELDGNDLQQKISKYDMLFQFQFFVRRKLDFDR